MKGKLLFFSCTLLIRGLRVFRERTFEGKFDGESHWMTCSMVSDKEEKEQWKKERERGVRGRERRSKGKREEVKEGVSSCQSCQRGLPRKQLLRKCVRGICRAVSEEDEIEGIGTPLCKEMERKPICESWGGSQDNHRRGKRCKVLNGVTQLDVAKRKDILTPHVECLMEMSTHR